MRVEQQNQILEALQQAAGKDVKTASGIVAEKAKTIKSVSDRQTSIQMKDTTYLNPAREEKKSIAEKIEESSEMDAFERKNQMAVLSNTTSEEDYAKMQEEGFSLDSTDSHTIITVTDKIKMQLAHHFQLAFGTAGGFFLIFCLFGKLADHQFGHGRLVFHHIRAAFLGLQRHLLGHFQAAVMVYACFGNDDGMQKNSSCLRVWPCRGRAIHCLFLL